MIPPSKGIERLQKGNARYMSGISRRNKYTRKKPGDLVSGQQPFAVILGCSDSRVPMELIFDQDLGDLFVIRVAGNIAGPTQIGSIEFALEILGTKLVLVLGHTGCGAVQAALSDVEKPDAGLSEGLKSIVDAIKPSIGSSAAEVAKTTVDQVVRKNVEHTAAALSVESTIIRNRLRDKRVEVVGGIYALDTGEVTFLK